MGLFLKLHTIKSIPVLVFVFFLLFSISALGDENPEVAKGKDLYQAKGCVACHTIGDGKLSGPDLKGVTERREEEWLKKWLKSPDKMVFTDPIAKEMLAEYMVPMPNQGLTDEEVVAIITYLKYEDAKN